MITGRFQSLNPQEILAYRGKQVDEEKARRPLYGLGKHVPGKNSHRGDRKAKLIKK